jgi:hypothetical protein
VVCAALHRGVVRNHDTLAALDHADARDDARRRRLALVEIPGGERVQLEKGRAGIDEAIDALTREELPPRVVSLHGTVAAATGHLGRARTQLGDECRHPLAPFRETLGAPFHL